MILEETYTLSNGVEIPKLGLGTWFIDDDKVAQAVRAAVEIGYRNIDTAQAYGNERGIGEGIRTSGLPRDELFVSTKLAVEIKDYDAAAAAIDGTVSLPKTANPEHMRSNAEVDFEISEADMGALRGMKARDYGEHSDFPVYSGK